MIYKVEYRKLAILKDNTIGNISQGNDIAYMDYELSQIEEKLNEFLLSSKQVADIFNVTKRFAHLVK